jgi:hypothetical protein
MDNCWIKPFTPPRPSVIGGGTNYKQWPIDPVPPSGTGETPVDGEPGPYQLLTDIDIISNKLYSVPGMGLKFDTEDSGDLSSTVEYHDDSSKTGSNELAQLIATPAILTAYTVGPSGVSCNNTGTFYSGWSALATPIPAMSGKIYYLSAYIVGDFIFIPFRTRHFVATAHLELGDVDGNVVAGVEVATFNSAEIYKGDTPMGYSIYGVEQSSVGSVSPGDGISISGIATQKRCKAVVTTFIDTSYVSVNIINNSYIRG